RRLLHLRDSGRGAVVRLGWLDLALTRHESLNAIKRAGADIILTYFAKELAALLKQGSRSRETLAKLLRVRLRRFKTASVRPAANRPASCADPARDFSARVSRR